MKCALFAGGVWINDVSAMFRYDQNGRKTIGGIVVVGASMATIYIVKSNLFNLLQQKLSMLRLALMTQLCAALQ